MYLLRKRVEVQPARARPERKASPAPAPRAPRGDEQAAPADEPAAAMPPDGAKVGPGKRPRFKEKPTKGGFKKDDDRGPSWAKKQEPRGRKGKFGDDGVNPFARAARPRKKGGKKQTTEARKEPVGPPKVVLGETIAVGDLAT